VAFNRPGAPRIPKGVGDRLQVISHTGCQTCERLQVAGGSGKQPLLERRHVQIMQRDAKALDELVAGIERRIRCQDPLEIDTLIVFQSIRCPEEQPGPRPSEQPTLGVAACFRRTPACNHPAHGGAFAEVPQLLNVACELTAIAAAIGPPLQQIGQERFDQPWDVAVAHVLLTGAVPADSTDAARSSALD
jgi:hypothetical protein